MIKNVDYIIVGQGLAGSVLAYYLEKHSKTFIIIDEKQGETSSKKATGLINPITGRRFVKSWLIDELLPFARDFYKELELKLSSKFLKETKVNRILQSVEQQNDWSAKLNDDRYSKYLQKNELIHHDNNLINNPLGCIEIEPLLQVNTPNLIEGFTTYFLEQRSLLKEKFDYNSINIEDDYVEYKDIKASKLIFCEGYNAINNPYFNYLPFLLSKGEVVLFESEELPDDFILGGNTNITPIGNHVYSIGATYAWNDITMDTSQAKRIELIEKLENAINCTYKVIGQKAGIRPTVKDRRPLLGHHSKYNNLLIFNGMGTKGLSLAPYFANHLVQHLTTDEKIMSEVSIERFSTLIK